MVILLLSVCGEEVVEDEEHKEEEQKEYEKHSLCARNPSLITAWNE